MTLGELVGKYFRSKNFYTLIKCAGGMMYTFHDCDSVFYEVYEHCDEFVDEIIVHNNEVCFVLCNGGMQDGV